MNNYSTGAKKSPYDIRTLSYVPTKGGIKGGERYEIEDIENQHRVGICTSISMTMNAGKALGKDFSADFQYLLQKRYTDGNWTEGSSAFSALKVGNKYGFLLQKYWKHTTIEDRKLPYHEYIEKLKAVPDSEIDRLLEISKKYKLAGYARVKVRRDDLANAIDESKTGLISRFSLGDEWYKSPIEPLRRAKVIVSGHLVTISNYSGGSFRIANSWGDTWADKGTAYFLLRNLRPTEAWIPYYNELPKEVEEQKVDKQSVKGQILNLIQQIIVLIAKL